jgi:hypothetical protein
LLADALIYAVPPTGTVILVRDDGLNVFIPPHCNVKLYVSAEIRNQNPEFDDPFNVGRVNVIGADDGAQLMIRPDTVFGIVVLLVYVIYALLYWDARLLYLYEFVSVP